MIAKESGTMPGHEGSTGPVAQPTAVPSRLRESHYFSKWLTFSASAIIMLQAGLAYSFSVYSNVLKVGRTGKVSRHTCVMLILTSRPMQSYTACLCS